MRKHKITIGVTCCADCHTCHAFLTEALVHYLRLHPGAVIWQVPPVWTTLS